jgi:hypothetical protein
MSIERIALILFATIALGLAVAQTGRSQGFPQGGLPVPSPPMGSPVMVSGPGDRVWITQGDKLWACKLSEAGKIGCEGFSLSHGK